ncbi:CDP-diacylglycerol--serine O-phosphatidyltransferase 2-like [Phalaenopsis equestris]|uniref:CDP-diacylglycerol--serine O-phosphatidyltransferase 2-like n=1 Tax=Phalaenopsis equestris TaxID=78828 RepID=UPI0009E59AB3|nr:CDP-diacylglycerol--serine O-phosphatidyltransferase 2-like [Phalaenopsis equestris]
MPYPAVLAARLKSGSMTSVEGFIKVNIFLDPTLIFGANNQDICQGIALAWDEGLQQILRVVLYHLKEILKGLGQLSPRDQCQSKVKRTLGQFTPAQWDKDEWHPLQGPWRFIQVLTLCVVFLTVELNTFFLKFCLWIPPGNPVVIYRLILWWIIAIPTIREYNSYLQDRKPTKKIGAFCWLSLAICIVELLICIKFCHGLFPNPMPPAWLVIFWASMGLMLVLFLLFWTWRNHCVMHKKRQ